MALRKKAILLPTLLAATLLAVALGAAPGCAGGYILTVPDQIAPAGGEAVTVVRLQRAEVILLALPVEDALFWFRPAGDEKGRGAYTDSLGYAGTTVTAPAAPGRYGFRVFTEDKEGEEVYQEVPFHVWEANRPAVAVDLDSLPPAWLKDDATAARQGLERLARDRNICYMTRRPVASHPAAHRELEQGGYPDGPVLLWQQERWHIVREGRWGVPRVVVESRLVNQLPLLRKMLPGLEAGLTNSSAAAKTFAEAGMRVVIVGAAPANAGNVTRLAGWKDLAQRGL
jgi:hypothetical protein